jgi:protein-L-isoaspartate(D-aspartate) O-methyltransferase
MLGWREFAPYERILFSAAIDSIPPAIVDQLKEGGILVAPLKRGESQQIVRYIKRGGQLEARELGECLFIDSKTGVE